MSSENRPDLVMGFEIDEPDSLDNVVKLRLSIQHHRSTDLGRLVSVYSSWIEVYLEADVCEGLSRALLDSARRLRRDENQGGNK